MVQKCKTKVYCRPNHRQTGINQPKSGLFRHHQIHIKDKATICHLIKGITINTERQSGANKMMLCVCSVHLFLCVHLYKIKKTQNCLCVLLCVAFCRDESKHLSEQLRRQTWGREAESCTAENEGANEMNMIGKRDQRRRGTENRKNKALSLM